MALELKVNPFLRCSQAAVVRMARDKGASDGGAVAVLATLREWKNNF